jgi:hypothetical protein
VWTRVGVVASVGLVIGVLWPRLAGLNVGPHVPGANKQIPTATASMGAAALSRPAASAVPLSASADAPTASNEQLVVVGEGRIDRCWHKRERLSEGQCGPLRVDRALVPRLQQLATCPSALGLKGQLQLGFDLDFKGKEIRLLKGKDKSDLPSSTVRGIMGCVADYVRDVSHEKIRHKYSKYRVYYTLQFYPPGSPPPTAPAESDESAAGEQPDAQGIASVVWDTALIRDEPKAGKVIARLVRGTRVELLGKRKDWYRVRIRTKEGWVYRGAIGR